MPAPGADVGVAQSAAGADVGVAQSAAGAGGPPGSDAAPTARRPRTLDARALLGDERVLHIEHGGEVYTLRLTRNDRLILTK